VKTTVCIWRQNAEQSRTCSVRYPLPQRVHYYHEPVQANDRNARYARDHGGDGQKIDEVTENKTEIPVPVHRKRKVENGVEDDDIAVLQWEKTQNRRQKVFDRGALQLCRGLCVCAGGLDIMKFTKTPLMYSVSRFILGGLGALFGGD